MTSPLPRPPSAPACHRSWADSSLAATPATRQHGAGLLGPAVLFAVCFGAVCVIAV